MWKFIKNLFTKKSFTLDDLDLSQRAQLTFFDIKNTWDYKVYFYHPLYKSLWPIPSRKVSTYSKWLILKRGKVKDKDILSIHSFLKYDTYERFKTLNHLKIYFDSLEEKYNELHEKK